MKWSVVVMEGQGSTGYGSEGRSQKRPASTHTHTHTHTVPVGVLYVACARRGGHGWPRAGKRSLGADVVIRRPTMCCAVSHCENK